LEQFNDENGFWFGQSRGVRRKGGEMEEEESSNGGEREKIVDVVWHIALINVRWKISMFGSKKRWLGDGVTMFCFFFSSLSTRC